MFSVMLPHPCKKTTAAGPDPRIYAVSVVHVAAPLLCRRYTHNDLSDSCIPANCQPSVVMHVSTVHSSSSSCDCGLLLLVQQQLGKGGLQAFTSAWWLVRHTEVQQSSAGARRSGRRRHWDVWLMHTLGVVQLLAPCARVSNRGHGGPACACTHIFAVAEGIYCWFQTRQRSGWPCHTTYCLHVRQPWYPSLHCACTCPTG
jgi:hypothetical protein